MTFLGAPTSRRPTLEYSGFLGFGSFLNCCHGDMDEIREGDKP